MKLVLLSLLALASAQDQLTCAIDGSGSLDAAVNAGANLWAASTRCQKGTAASDDIKCEIDIASAVASITDMGNMIAKAVDGCAGDLKAANAECGEAAGSMVSAASGLAAGAGQLTHWITRDDGAGGPVDDMTNTGKCIVDAKSVVNSIFQAAAAIKAAKAGCAEGEKVCASNSLTIISILSGLGSAVSAIVGDCFGDKRAGESGDLLALVDVVNKVAQAGIAISQKCKVSDARLYSNISIPSSKDGFSTSSLVAFAIIPMAALIGFVGGRRTKAVSFQQVRDVEDVITE